MTSPVRRARPCRPCPAVPARAAAGTHAHALQALARTSTSEAPEA